MYFYLRTLNEYTIKEKTGIYSFKTPSRLKIGAPKNIKHNRHGLALQRAILGNEDLNRVAFAKVELKDNNVAGNYYVCTLIITTRLCIDDSIAIIKDLGEYRAKFETRNVNFKRDTADLSQDLIVSFDNKEKVFSFAMESSLNYMGYAKRIAHITLDNIPETLLLRLFIPASAFKNILVFKNEFLSLLDDVVECETCY